MPDPSRVERLHKLLLHRPVVATLLRACENAGGVPVHLVGGLLRDRLLGLPSRDYDAVVSGHGADIAAEVAERLGAHLVHLGGKDFAAYRVVGSGDDEWVLDVWDREDMSLGDDLRRRDLTVNAFALDLRANAHPRFADPFGGVADIDRRLLRATTETSFTGDPLRVLRLPRLLVQLPGFSADPATLELAQAAAPGLANVASERVREELVLIFKREDAHRAFGLLAALDVYPGLWRGEPGQPASAAGQGRAGRALLELERLLPRAREVTEILVPTDGGTPSRVDLLAARYAVTFAHLLPAEGTLEERARAAAGAAERFRDAGYMTGNLAARVIRLVRETEIPGEEREQRRFLHRLGDLWPTAVALLGARQEAGGEAAAADLVRWRRTARELATLVRDEGRQILQPPRLLGGQEVQELLGIGPGPRVGEALAAIERAQVDGDVTSREAAVALLRRRFG